MFDFIKQDDSLTRVFFPASSLEVGTILRRKKITGWKSFFYGSFFSNDPIRSGAYEYVARTHLVIRGDNGRRDYGRVFDSEDDARNFFLVKLTQLFSAHANGLLASRVIDLNRRLNFPGFNDPDELTAERFSQLTVSELISMLELGAVNAHHHGVL